MRKWFRGISFVLVFAMVMAPALLDSVALAASKAPSVLILKAGEVKGRLTDSTGKVVAKTDVRIVGKKGEVVAKALTGKTGTFTLKNVPIGDYKMQVAKLQSFNIKVLKKAELSSLQIVLPGKKYAAGALSGAAWTWIIVGGIVVAAAIAIPIAASGGGGGDDDYPW